MGHKQHRLGVLLPLLKQGLLEQQARGVRETALSVPTREVAKSFLALNNTEIDLSDTRARSFNGNMALRGKKRKK